MRKVLIVAIACVVVATGCASGGTQRTILVDYSHDEFPSFVASNFPGRVAVHPGTELVFKQTWTGEPHSVTGGTLANELMEAVRPYMEKAARGEEIPHEPPKEIVRLEKKVAWAYDFEGGGFDKVNQTGAQPCYLARGEPRTDGKPCATREQPVFNGRHTFYNSGIIPYDGPRGNEYRIKLADDIGPGSYWFYCNYHGEFQSTEVVVTPRSEKVPTAEQVSQQALKEVQQATGGFERIVRDAQDGEVTLPTLEGGDSITIEGNFAGLFDPRFEHWHSINGFIPNRITAKAGEDITWNLVGFHTISFGVPRYFPVFTFKPDGTVERNRRLDPPAGGANEFDVPEEERYDESRTEPVRFDGGTWNGRGFWSSGTIDATPYIAYTMRITEPGTYRFACLIHPPMVGTVEVT